MNNVDLIKHIAESTTTYVKVYDEIMSSTDYTTDGLIKYARRFDEIQGTFELYNNDTMTKFVSLSDIDGSIYHKSKDDMNVRICVNAKAALIKHDRVVKVTKTLNHFDEVPAYKYRFMSKNKVYKLSRKFDNYIGALMYAGSFEVFSNDMPVMKVSDIAMMHIMNNAIDQIKTILVNGISYTLKFHIIDDYLYVEVINDIDMAFLINTIMANKNYKLLIYNDKGSSFQFKLDSVVLKKIIGVLLLDNIKLEQVKHPELIPA